MRIPNYTNGRLFKNDRDFFKEFGYTGLQKMTEFIKDKPHLRIKQRNPKGRYIKLTGSQRENIEMMDILKDKILPYPKRD